MRDVAIRLSFCLFPLALTPLWGYLIADGYLNFGGGEKDLLLLIPWILWSLLYLVIFVVTWFQRLPLKRGLVFSTVGATVVIVLLWLAMFVWSQGLLGVS
jgi:hypothetical protein